MTNLPIWYIRAATGALAGVGLLGIVLLCLLASSMLIERILRLVQLHDCFIDFMVGWVRDRHTRREAAAHKRGL